MPAYVYACDACNTRSVEVHSMREDPEILCACGKRKRRAITGKYRGIRVAQVLKDCVDYREDLARPLDEVRADPNRPAGWKPADGDPQAYVNGPDSLRRLWDRRQREGWTKKGPWGSKPERLVVKPEKSMRDYYREARAQVQREDRLDLS